SLAPAQARAGFVTYSYSGSGIIDPGLDPSSLTGSFQVDMAVVASGHIHLSDLQNVSFTFSALNRPDVTFTLIDDITGNNGVIDVNAQGVPTSRNDLFFMSVGDPYGQGSGALLGDVQFNFSGTFPTDSYLVVYDDPNPNNNFLGSGGDFGTNWTVTG